MAAPDRPHAERQGGQGCRRRRYPCHLDRLSPAALSFHAAICAGARASGDRGDAGLPALELHHHRRVDCFIPADVARQRRDPLCTGPADLARACGRLCRAQQRGVFHPMVSSLPTAEARRPAAGRPAPSALIPRGPTMQNVFARLATDFFSTIVFLVVYLATDNIVLATGVAIAGAIGQVIYSRIKGRELGFMTWASLGLV